MVGAAGASFWPDLVRAAGTVPERRSVETPGSRRTTLREVETELAAHLLEASPVGILVIDEAGVITHATASVDELLGYGVSEIEGSNILDHLHPVAVQGLLESVSYVQEYTGSTMGPLSLAIVHADGELRVLEVYANNRYDDPTIRGLVAVVRDKTCQHRINEALTSYTEGCETDEALLILCQALLGLPVSGRAAFVETGTGQPVAKIQLPSDLFELNSETRARWGDVALSAEGFSPPTLDAYDDAFAERARAAGLATVWAHPVATRHLSGRSLCLVIGRIAEGEPSLNEQMTVALVARNARLVVERDWLQSQFVEHEKLAALGALSAGVAHELQNPLNFVVNFSQAIEEEIQDLLEVSDREAASGLQNAEPVEQLAELGSLAAKIKTHGERASQIAKGMLFNASTSNEWANVELGGLVDEAVQTVSSDVGAPLTVERDIPVDLPSVDVMPLDLRQCIANLVQNAHEATRRRAARPDANGYTPETSVSARRLEETVEIAVTDNGAGIPEDVRSQVFTPFFTTKPPNEGVGLGLTQALATVRAHGGVMEIDSVVDDHTSVTIVMPLRRAVEHRPE